MSEQRSINWADAASIDLGRAWGLSFLCSSFLDHVEGESRDELRARQASMASTLQHIAVISKSVADQFEAAPKEVKESVRRASGVAAVVAREAFTEFGMQYRDDITDWAMDAVTQALESAKATVDGWITRMAEEARANGGSKHA